MDPSPAEMASTHALSDDLLVSRILSGEFELFEIVMRRHNRQLYRAARAITGGDDEVEDILQQSYLNAFAHLGQFEARAQLSTWLTRIVINEASARRRRAQRAAMCPLAVLSADMGAAAPEAQRRALPSPEQQAYAGELLRALETAIDELPAAYRLVYTLRDVEGMSTSETATALALGDEAVKTRLHRARAMLRRAIGRRMGTTAPELFQFHAPRCNRIVAAVIGRLTVEEASLPGRRATRADHGVGYSSCLATKSVVRRP
jgi:RNA polymerase sigma-70 factor (ECF subfamily)